MSQHRGSICIWNIYLAAYTLRFIQEVIDSVSAIKKATVQMVSSDRVKIFTSKDLRSPS